MAYIFRPENLVGDNTLQGWKKSAQYGQNIIDSLIDPNEEVATKEITSIPSPFARIELVKTAFKNVSKKKGDDYVNLEGNTIFHKMVSDSLDVAQIFFEYSKYSKQKCAFWACEYTNIKTITLL